jgi:hypothetical protein
MLCSLEIDDMDWSAMKGKTAAPIQLAPPGAGIPPLEITLAKVLFAVLRRTKGPGWATRHFHGEASTMVRLAGSLAPQAANTPVLIPRIAGIEDSSRNWSVLMTLDHLVIVNSAIIDIIESLSSERLHSRRVSIAEVKPRATQSLETINRFARTTQNYVERISHIGNLVSSTRHSHPWFGPLDALGWHWLATIHHTIHRRQIQKIIAEGPSQPSRHPMPSTARSFR